MTNARLFCLPAGLLILGMAGLSAQVPKVGTAPVVKSGDPSKPAQIKPADPVKAPNPVPLPKVGPPSVVPPGGVNPPGVPPVMPKDVVPPLGPGKKEEDQYPKEIEEKTLNMWMNELRTSKDAQVREAAVRVVPLFGPRAIALKATSELLLATLKTDPDLNVRLAALSVAPYMSYNQQEDPLCNDRIDIVTRMLSSESLPVRYDATIAMAGIGPVAKKAIPQLVARTNEPASWLTRKAAASALGSVGRGWVNPDNPADKVDPAELAVTALLNQVKADPSAAVRREAANSLILVGPVSAAQLKVWKISMEAVLKNEKDRATQNLLRVAVLKNDPAGIKANEPLLAAITEQLLAKDSTVRNEACQALGMLGDAANKKAPELLDVITNPKEDNSVTTAAIVAVTGMTSQKGMTVPVLKKVAETHKNDDVRAYAKEAVRILQGGENKGVLPGVVDKK